MIFREMSTPMNENNGRKTALAIPDIIRRKRNGKTLTEEEIEFFVKATCDHSIQDAQLGAMLMAMFIRGLDDAETTYLTKSMTQSGEVLSWPAEWKGSVLDKHSTGGVGDKVSLLLAPALAACGYKIPMVSGRGLGHTGGTLDKLEAIPGFNVNFTHEQMLDVMDKVGCCIVGQTKNLVPADKFMYAVRDVTATTENAGLITSSIISKKAAESLDALVLDVKCGSGSFQKTMDDSRDLASRLVKAGNGSGVKTVALLTDMSSPLGNMIGNALEVVETLQCLRGDGPADVTDLVTRLGGHLLHASNKVNSLQDGYDTISKTLENGTALGKFNAMMKAQGVDPDSADKMCAKDATFFDVLPKAKYTTGLKAATAGYIHEIHALKCALASYKLGAGRSKAGDSINFAVGLELRRHVGDQVKEGETWIVVHHDTEQLDDCIARLLEKALTIKEEEYKSPHNAATRVIDVVTT